MILGSVLTKGFFSTKGKMTWDQVCSYFTLGQVAKSKRDHAKARKTWQQMWMCLAPGQVLASPPVQTSTPGNIREDDEDENFVEEDDDGGNVLPVLPFPS